MNTEQERMLRDLHEAVVGNPQLRQKGIIERVELLEKHKEKQNARITLLSGVVAGATLGLQKAFSYLKELF